MQKGVQRTVGIVSVFILLFLSIGVLVYSGLWIWMDARTYETFSKWLAIHQTFAAGIVGALTMLLGISIAWWQLSSVRRTRYAELLLHLSQVWDSNHYVESRNLIDNITREVSRGDEAKVKLCEKLEKSDKEGERDYFVLIRTPNFFEALAFLVRRKYIPLSDTRDYFGQAIVYYHDLFSTHISQERRKSGHEKTYELWSGLADKLRRR